MAIFHTLLILAYGVLSESIAYWMLSSPEDIAIWGATLFLALSVAHHSLTRLKFRAKEMKALHNYNEKNARSA